MHRHNPPGVVDVTVYALQANAGFYYVPNDKAPDLAFYEPVFFPIAFTRTGSARVAVDDPDSHAQ